MQADTIRFEEIFDIDGVSGRISLGADRYVMFDSEAIGKMRRELIDNLGWDVARGILERVGYQSGRNDARQLRERYPGSSDEEWLRAGPRLHFLQGVVRVRVEKAALNRASGLFHMKGEWLDSYEAEQHLRHYGPGSRTACWTLEGYATGYASEMFGSAVVCVETECRAKGDPSCRFELRPAQEWGQTARRVHEMLSVVRFTERFDRCLRSINEMGCQLEQSSLDAIITTDADGIIASCSAGGGELLGLSPGDARGLDIREFCARDRAEADSIFELLRSDGRIRNYLTEFITHNGRRTPVALSMSAVHSPEGGIIGIIAVAHNLSEIRRLEDELAAKNRFMANILQDSADAIITLDPANRITGWNRGAEIIFGWNAHEAVGRSIEMVIPPEKRLVHELAEISEKMRKQGAVRNYQAERITKDGRRIQIIFTRTEIRNEEGEVAGSSVVLKDITALRNLERQLADAEHLATLGELSAGLAHEIKNPLAGIKGAIDVIRDSMQQNDLHREILGDVLHEVNRIDRIVRDLLNYAKPKPPELVPVDLKEIAQRMVAMARQSLKTDRVQIGLELLGTVPAFTADETQLEQVILNLLLNALSACRSGGKVTLRLAYDHADWNVRIEVEDTGPGITEEVRQKLFQPFFTTRTDGTGLGLATCLKNVQYHGGTIDVWSEADKGTLFTVRIPLLCRY